FVARSRSNQPADQEPPGSTLARGRIERVKAPLFRVLVGDSVKSPHSKTEHSRAGKKTRDFGLAYKLRDRILSVSGSRFLVDPHFESLGSVTVQTVARKVLQPVIRPEWPDSVRCWFAPCAAVNQVFFLTNVGKPRSGA